MREKAISGRSSDAPAPAVGAPGRIVASQGIRMLEIPTSFDRSRGDVHAMGNPHFLIDPLNVKIIAATIAEHFSQVSPKSADVFKANLKKFASAVLNPFRNSPRSSFNTASIAWSALQKCNTPSTTASRASFVEFAFARRNEFVKLIAQFFTTKRFMKAPRCPP